MTTAKSGVSTLPPRPIRVTSSSTAAFRKSLTFRVVQLNYHPDSVRSLLLLRVPISPVKSLLRLSLDACVLHFEILVSGPGVSLGDLPARLRATLEGRHIYESLGRDPNFGDPDNPPSEEDPFDREMLHSGI